MNLWLLALVGASLTWIADVLCVTAARNGELWLVAFSAILFASGAPIWFYMSRMSGGSLVVPALCWNAVAMVLSLVAVITMEHDQSPRQWAGLAIVFIGMLVRG